MSDRTTERLTVLGLDGDGTALVLADPADDERRLLLPLDARVRAALRGDLPGSGDAPLRMPSGVVPGPREIQARLRAGDTVEQIAAENGVPVDKIARWEGPVLAEREHVLTAALAASLPDGRTLADAVAETVGAAGHDPGSVMWTTVRGDDRVWQVVGTRGARRGCWSWHPTRRRLEPTDAGSRTLLDDPPAPTASLRTAGPRRYDVPLPGQETLDGEPAAHPDDEQVPQVVVPGWDAIMASTRPRRGLRLLDEDD